MRWEKTSPTFVTNLLRKGKKLTTTTTNKNKKSFAYTPQYNTMPLPTYAPHHINDDCWMCVKLATEVTFLFFTMNFMLTATVNLT